MGGRSDKRKEGSGVIKITLVHFPRKEYHAVSRCKMSRKVKIYNIEVQVIFLRSKAAPLKSVLFTESWQEQEVATLCVLIMFSRPLPRNSNNNIIRNETNVALVLTIKTDLVGSVKVNDVLCFCSF